MTYESEPRIMIYEGQAIIPSKFIVRYRTDLSGTAPTITFWGLQESTGEPVKLSVTHQLSNTDNRQASCIIDAKYIPILALYYEIANYETVGEIYGIELGIRGNASITIQA